MSASAVAAAAPSCKGAQQASSAAPLPHGQVMRRTLQWEAAMPTRERVEDFIARVQRGQSLELMPEFYAEDATAQENGAPPRVGLATLMEHERPDAGADGRAARAGAVVHRRRRLGRHQLGDRGGGGAATRSWRSGTTTIRGSSSRR